MRALLVSVSIVAGIWLLAIVVLLFLSKPKAARELATLLPNLLLLFKDLAKHPDMPRSTRWMLVGAAVWIASPIDLIPEFIPVLGPLDDALVAALVLRRTLRSVEPAVVRSLWRGDPATADLLLRVATRGL
ncbi:MAG: YkvA family protein [Actinomycetota bacterium]